MHELKLADFGLSRLVDKNREAHTRSVITLWYRPPELLLGSTNYSFEVDMWGVGCIIMELFLRRPLFMADTELGLLRKIFGVCGTPTPETWPEFHSLPVAKSTKVPAPLSLS